MKVDKFIFPMEFAIIDVDDKVKLPVILGRPILATSKALIDVRNGRMALRVGKEEIIFKLQNSMRHTMDFDGTCY